MPGSWTGAIGLGLGLGLGLLISRRALRNIQDTTLSPSSSSPPPPPTTTASTFANAVVVVTGGANGIGSGVVRAFHAAGALVFFADVDVTQGELLASELGSRVCFRACDVSKSEAIRSFVDYVTNVTNGRINVLVNNVGVQLDDGTPAHLLDESVWDKVIAINLTSYFLFSKYCLPSLMSSSSPSKNSTIINMSSVQGLQSQSGIPAYAVSKGGILSMTRQMSMDYAKKGVRVVAINPGTIRTPLFENLLIKRNGKDKLNESLQQAANVYPIQRIGEIEEIASVCLFLASKSASFITGESITVDGGIMAMGGWSGAA